LPWSYSKYELRRRLSCKPIHTDRFAGQTKKALPTIIAERALGRKIT
jgi:hypothetical protein